MANTYDDNQVDPGFRRRRPRPVTDYGSSVVQWISNRKPRYRGIQHYEQERPSPSYVVDMLPPAARLDSPAESIPVRHLHTSLGKSKKPVTVVRWMPEGRRLLAGVHNGEFMLWNGMSFNFETVTAMGSSSLRAAEWSNKKDWLIAANDEGIVFYLQPTLNNPHQFRGHESPIRGLAFSPSDSKFVTASDDNTVKIWDFVSSTNESTFKDHGWDVKSCDWHPTKGLVVSGSKDHTVKLWDPRTTRSLTTLHGHTASITATVFSRVRDQLLATAGRDAKSRIFDLRMMRDVCQLKGFDTPNKGISSISWHPIHPSLIAAGGEDGALNSYLLNEPNTPPGVSTASMSPYYTSDPSSASAQTIYPAHRIPHAHDSSIWSIDWHPFGHIVATGSNDHYTRFWSRSLPGQTACFRDQFHLGEEGAEAQGTWDRKTGRKQAREQEEQEAQDEAEGLEDQDSAGGSKPAFSIPGLPLPGLPGLGTSTGPAPLLPGMPPPSIPFSTAGPSSLPTASPMPNLPPMDPNLIAQLLQQSAHSSFSAPPGIPQQQPSSFSAPMPETNNFSLPPIDFSKFAPGVLPMVPPPPGSDTAPHFPPGLAPPGSAPGQLNGRDTAVGGGGGGGRRRVPLPSQKEGFKAEQARGNFRAAR